MKRCSQCEREIPESATTCGQCDVVNAAPVSFKPVPDKDEAVAPLNASVEQRALAPALPALPPPTPAIPPAALVVLPAAPAAGLRSNRGMLVAAFLVVGGTLTFAMLRSSAPAVPLNAPAAAPALSAPGLAAPKPAPGVAPVVTSKWTAANSEWLLNARKGVAFELPALNRVTIWQGLTRPMLVVRCDAGKMQMFVYTASAIQMEAQDENHSVHISFDDEAEATERWADSSDHDALFAPDAAAFARRVTTARTLRVGYTPHNAQRVVAQFQVSGLNDVLEQAAKQCGWAPAARARREAAERERAGFGPRER